MMKNMRFKRDREIQLRMELEDLQKQYDILDDYSREHSEAHDYISVKRSEYRDRIEELEKELSELY